MNDYSRYVIPPIQERPFWQVIDSIQREDIPDPMQYGYETRREFHAALCRLLDRWRGRVGEQVEERYGGSFLRLRFHDTPGMRPDEACIPRFLLVKVPVPDYVIEKFRDPTPEELLEQELDEAYGFDWWK